MTTIPPPRVIARMSWHARRRLAGVLTQENADAVDRHRAILAARSDYVRAVMLLRDLEPDPPEIVQARIAELLDDERRVPALPLIRDDGGRFARNPDRPEECYEPGCTRKRAKGRTRCGACYERHYNRKPGVQRGPRGKALCILEDCDRKRSSHGLCDTHWYRKKTYGDVLADVPITRRKPFPAGRKPNQTRKVAA